MSARRLVVSAATVVALTGLVLVSLASIAAAKPSTATVKVELTDAGCPKRITAPAGKILFKVRNVDATSVTEFEVLKGDGILGEKESLTPGLSGEFALTLKAGRYTTYCPNGDRERGALVVRGATDLAATTVGECAPVGDISTATSRTAVSLDEWAIDFGGAEATAGNVGIEATNTGKRAHELVVLSGVDPNALPRDENGALDESGLPKGALIGEIEPFAAGTECSGVFALPPGEYVVVCNITNKPKSKHPVSHLAKGMVSRLTVR
jgi:hypothetical protein